MTALMARITGAARIVLVVLRCAVIVTVLMRVMHVADRRSAVLRVRHARHCVYGRSKALHRHYEQEDEQNEMVNPTHRACSLVKWPGRSNERSVALFLHGRFLGGLPLASR